MIAKTYTWTCGWGGYENSPPTYCCADPSNCTYTGSDNPGSLTGETGTVSIKHGETVTIKANCTNGGQLFQVGHTSMPKNFTCAWQSGGAGSGFTQESWTCTNWNSSGSKTYGIDHIECNGPADD